MTAIAIVDYGMGNLRSVSKALERVAPYATVQVTSDPEIVDKATHVVVPGQGAMLHCMQELDKFGLKEVVIDAARNKPFLGICIGLQMLFDESEEGNVKGLGVFPGRVVHFSTSSKTDIQDGKLKIPHMGWNQVYQTMDHPLWDGIRGDVRFYFVHSYYVQSEDPNLSAAYSLYPTPFTCAIAKNNIFAVQFHPEKSHIAGLTLLSNFAKWEPHSSH